MSRDLIAHEVRELSRTVSDKAAIANHISLVHGVEYTASDVTKILSGKDPEPRLRSPVQVRVSDLMGGHLPLSPPLTTTNDNGVDPLAKALAAYHAKRTSGEVRAYWERLAA